MSVVTYQNFMSPEECEEILTTGLTPEYQDRIARAVAVANSDVFHEPMGSLRLSVVEDGAWQPAAGAVSVVLQLSPAGIYDPPCDGCPRNTGTMLVYRTAHGLGIEGDFVVGYA